MKIIVASVPVIIDTGIIFSNILFIFDIIKKKTLFQDTEVVMKKFKVKPPKL